MEITIALVALIAVNYYFSASSATNAIYLKQVIMLDPNLENLNKFNNPEFLELEIKRKFSQEYYDTWYMGHMPTEHKPLSSYKYELTDPGNGKKIRYEYNFDDYIQKYLEEYFLEFYNNFYKIIVRNKDKIGNHNYFTLLSKQLGVILKKIEKNDSISNKYKSNLIKQFRKGREIFIKRFGEEVKLKNLGRLDVPNSFYFKHINTRPGELNRIRIKLIDSGLIDKQTSKAQFGKLFENNPVINKVDWTGNKSQFYYFIKRLNIHDDFKDLEDYKWEVALHCFKFIDRKTGSQFDWKKLRRTHEPQLEKKLIIDYCLEI